MKNILLFILSSFTINLCYGQKTIDSSETISQEQAITDTIANPDELPYFANGGEQGLQKILINDLENKIPIINPGFYVIGLSITVETDGSVGNVEITESNNTELGEIIKKSISQLFSEPGTFIPAKENKTPIKYSFEFPLVINIE